MNRNATALAKITRPSLPDVFPRKRLFDLLDDLRKRPIIWVSEPPESLKDLLARLRSIPPKLAVDYLIQICAGLEYGHNKGIIHRDVNVTNIFVQQNDRLKILDFGLACPIGTEDFASLGTVAYMAPEQIISEALDQLAEDLDLKTDNASTENLNMASFFMVYRNGQQQAFKQFMETISTQAKSLGISLKSAEFSEE
ncbi:MAG: protein kinase [Desulfobacterales bacterium]